MVVAEVTSPPLASLYNHACTLCGICQNVKSVCVAGRGPDSGAKIVIFGEAPGPQEDEAGVPFIGRSGQLLGEMLTVAGVDLNLVRVENIVRGFPKSKTDKIRPPTDAEVEICIQYTYAVLDTLLSRGETPVLVPMGNVAMEALTGYAQITKNRGRFLPMKVLESYKEKYGHLEGKFDVIGTIHPAAVLRGNEGYKNQIISDLGKAWGRATGVTKTVEYWKNYKWVTDLDWFDTWVHVAIQRYKAGQIPWVALDLETTTKDETYDLENQRVVCFSVCIDPGVGIVVPLYHKDSPFKNDPTSIKQATRSLGKLIAEVPVTGWNFAYDLKWLWLHMGVKPKELGFDGFLASKWVWGSRLQDHTLNTRAIEELGFEGHGDEIKVEMSLIKDPAERHYGNSSQSAMLRYSGGDADATYQLSLRLREMLTKVPKAPDQFKAIQLDAVPVLCKMEVNGIKVDKKINEYLLVEYVKKMQPIEDRVVLSPWGQETAKYLASRETPLAFNLKSVETSRHLFFDAMRLPVQEEGKSGPSTDKDTIETLVEYCAKTGQKEKAELLTSIMEWKLLKHTYNNFIKNIDKYIKYDGYFHTQYNIAGAETGRMSTYQPSLHGQPKGSMARWQFISRWDKQGGLILSNDMSQMELRVLAALSGDENLLDTIRSGVDLHTANAAKMFKVSIENVTKKLRQDAKVANFAVAYGATASTIAWQTGSSVREGQAIIDSWYTTYPKTKTYQDREYALAKKTGYTYTPFGRIRWIKGVKESKQGDHAWRQCLNTGIQSVASDLTLSALIHSAHEIERRGLKSLLFGFIHDAIVCDVYPGELFDVLAIIRHSMTTWINETFPWMLGLVAADSEVGAGWGFPCDITEIGDSHLKIQGSAAHMTLLQLELQNLPWTVSMETKSADKLVAEVRRSA